MKLRTCKKCRRTYQPTMCNKCAQYKDKKGTTKQQATARKLSIEALTTQISYESEILKRWRHGDGEFPPQGWSIEQQKTFVRGMRHALYIIKAYNQFI